jgi:hypothetical protein
MSFATLADNSTPRRTYPKGVQDGNLLQVLAEYPR